MKEKGEKLSKVFFKFLFKKSQNLIKSIFLCVLRLEKSHLTSSPDVTLAAGNIATLSSLALYCIKINTFKNVIHARKHGIT